MFLTKCAKCASVTKHNIATDRCDLCNTYNGRNR